MREYAHPDRLRWRQEIDLVGAYPTLTGRLDFAHSFANNDALRPFYGYLPRSGMAALDLPVSLLLLGLAALAYATIPRASTGIAYGLVTLAFLWQLVGSLLGVPKWLVEATPFAHVGLVPTQAFRGGAAAIMVAIGLLAAAAALAAFRRRDLLGN